MPSGSRARARQVAGIVALIAGGAVLVASSARTWSAAAARIGPAWELVSRTTLEERRRAAYGDCGGYGYGYLTDVLRGLPGEEAFPVVKYADWSRNVQLLLPGRRTRLDERVLVGIGLADGHLAERAIARAAPVAEHEEGGVRTLRFTFSTQYDYDLLTGVGLELPAAAPAGAGDIELTLLESVRSGRVVARWTGRPPPDLLRFALRLPAPLAPFSRQRGATPFVLEVRTAAAVPRPSAVVPIGVRVDTRGYEPVSRRGACFTAVRGDALAAARAEPEGPWGRFLRGLR